MVNWPNTLPRVPLQDFTAKPSSGMNDWEEEVNPQRTRTYPEKDATFSFIMTTDEMQAVRTFYATTLNDGCAPFGAPWLTLLGYNFHFLRFTKEPSIARKELKWKVTLNVEIIAGVPVDFATNTPLIWDASADPGKLKPVPLPSNDSLTDSTSQAAYDFKTFTINAASLLENDTNQNGMLANLYVSGVSNPVCSATNADPSVSLNGTQITFNYGASCSACEAGFDYELNNGFSTVTGHVNIDACTAPCSSCSSCSCES